MSKLLQLNIDSKNLYIVASDSTNFIPWAMLDIDFIPNILPTASWLNLKSVNFDSKKIVIVGNPNFGGKAPQLDGAKNEAKEIAHLYNTKALLFDKATVKNLYENVGLGVDIIHFATHGIFYKNQPLKSALLLSDGKEVVFLNVEDIFNNPLKANLVVLSACESGLGKSASADDYLGLSRSLFLGGTKSILSSLWTIDDAGTKTFMKLFYNALKNKNYADSYKEAILGLKKKGYSKAIYGAFILQGLKGK